MDVYYIMYIIHILCIPDIIFNIEYMYIKIEN